MKIAQIAPLAESVPPRLYGGTERVVSYLAEELVRLGHDVTLFASGDSETSAKLVACSRRALRLDPGNATAQLALAQGLTRLGQAQPALEAALRAASLLPGDPAAEETLADARWLTGEVSAALEAYRTLSARLDGAAREGIMRKARTLVGQRSGWLGRLVAGIPFLFGVALRNGWLSVS